MVVLEGERWLVTEKYGAEMEQPHRMPVVEEEVAAGWGLVAEEADRMGAEIELLEARTWRSGREGRLLQWLGGKHVRAGPQVLVVVRTAGC